MIQAIRLYRERFDVGLKEAKDAVDRMPPGSRPERCRTRAQGLHDRLRDDDPRGHRRRRPGLALSAGRGGDERVPASASSSFASIADHVQQRPPRMQLNRVTKIGAAIAGLLAFCLSGAIAFAVLSLRSTPDSTGATPGAWVVVGIVVLLASLGAAAAGGAIVALLAWALLRFTRRSGP
jgi:hypothetical protein